KLGEGLGDALAARSLRLRIEPYRAEVLTDGRALRAVLANLLQNAIAFSPDGGEITVHALPMAAGLQIVVRNEGEGVDAADLPRLLQPFEQGENALTRHAEGAGLGLAICDLTCRAMGGRLELISARGEGFSAHIVLPTA
ncbi:MAG TPA: ATP-binding protein, partial [Caulobacteraceae bacterium]|nr:ATP-binding protein [Caulobacteraceae bacterium]